MARGTVLKTAWNLHPILARSRFQPCQYAGDVLGLRCSAHAVRTRGSATSSACAMPVNFSLRTRANASRILMLAPAQLIDDEVEQLLPNGQARTGQSQNVVAQPLSERSDVAGKRLRLCLTLTGCLQLTTKVLTTLARFADLGLQPSGAVTWAPLAWLASVMAKTSRWPSH